MLVAECLDFGELLVGGLILAGASTVAAVGVYDGIGGKGGGGREVHGVRVNSEQ